MWSLHDEDLPDGAVDRLDDGEMAAGDEFDASWELEALLDAHIDGGIIEADAIRPIVLDLDRAHALVAFGDPTAVDLLRDVMDRLARLIDDHQVPPAGADELVSLAQAALDMAEAAALERLPPHSE